MSARQIIGRRGVSARTARAAGFAWVLFIPAAGGGCQLMLDDIGAPADAARDPASAEGEDGGEPAGGSDAKVDPPGGASDAGLGSDALGGGALDAAEESADGSGAAEPDPQADAGDAPGPEAGAAGGGGSAGGGSAGGGSAGGGSAGGAGPAPGGGDPPDAATAPPDGAAPALDAAASCSEAVWWYEDEDRDGYGRASSKMRVCPAPAGSWALIPGDCNDDDPRVHPEQPSHFGEPYQAADGSDSFDYDCSGAEEGKDQQPVLASDACGLLSIALCGGSGYLPVRPGASNPWCGSHEKATCNAGVLGLVGCVANVDTVVDAYVCR